MVKKSLNANLSYLIAIAVLLHVILIVGNINLLMSFLKTEVQLYYKWEIKILVHISSMIFSQATTSLRVEQSKQELA